jgi:hypothetical protein
MLFLEVIMAQLALDNKVLATIAMLAKQLKTSSEDVVKKAVDNYAETVKQSEDMMSFAGILDEEEADEMLKTIYENRRNKDFEPSL